jgi:hypothetical protein
MLFHAHKREDKCVHIGRIHLLFQKGGEENLLKLPKIHQGVKKYGALPHHPWIYLN